jgi:uncharacterized protein (DUF427 family)
MSHRERQTSQSTITPARARAAAGQESVWDYPRPPRLEAVSQRLRVVLGGVTIADTVSGVRVLETSHPPNYYFPLVDVAPEALIPESGSSWCEWKGRAHYYATRGGTRVEDRAAWGYATPTPACAQLAGMVAFYAALTDACFVDDEQVRAQAGGFYGGWITDNIVGPFKGEPETSSW